jgi:hypothetical protein
MGTYRRPIQSAMETNQLVPASETCERCHWPQQFSGVRMRVIPDYADDEQNTRTQTVLAMMVGGGGLRGIHQAHFGPGVRIRYATTDSTRQTIPWVEYTDKSGTRTFAVAGSKAEEVANLWQYQMQCVDCHNRPTHTFELPERAMNRAMSRGQIPMTLPFIKKKGVEVLRTEYATREEAARKIPAAIREYYRQTQPAVYAARAADVETAGKAVLAIYNQNVFPDLKVTWGTFRNNLGHTDFPGCFRCHDELHASADGKTITQDCGACHELVSTGEKAPPVLQTLGVKDRFAELEKR